MQYLKYINKLKFKSKPDYQYCRNLFKKAVRDAGYTFNGDLSLNVNWLQVPRKVNILYGYIYARIHFSDNGRTENSFIGADKII